MTVMDPSFAPTRLKFKVEWTDDDACWVEAHWVKDGEDMTNARIGTLGWNGQEWWFYPLDPQAHDIHHTARQFIEVDPDQRMTLVNMQAEAFKDTAEAVKDAKLAAAKAKATMFRDEQRELAVIGAKFKARRWLPRFIELDNGCTATFDQQFLPSHDGDTCPVHEKAEPGDAPTDKLNDLIRFYRSEGWSHAEIAEQVGVTQNYVQAVIDS